MGTSYQDYILELEYENKQLLSLAILWPALLANGFFLFFSASSRESAKMAHYKTATCIVHNK